MKELLSFKNCYYIDKLFERINSTIVINEKKYFITQIELNENHRQFFIEIIGDNPYQYESRLIENFTYFFNKLNFKHDGTKKEPGRIILYFR